MANVNYRRGRAKEYRIKKKYEKCGYYVIRTAGSHGVCDLVAFGRDKKVKTKAKGLLVVTNKRIICAGNEYPFDKILSITRKGKLRKSILLTFEKAEIEVRGGGITAGGITVEVEIKAKDIDEVFRALERARLYGLGLNV